MREYIPCLTPLRQETALPASVAGPPMPERSFFRRLCSRPGLLPRLARGRLAAGVSMVNGGISGAPESGSPESGVSVEFAQEFSSQDG